MATAFAITGIHRSKLKHYRPSYQNELPPIYEDTCQTLKLDKYKCAIPSNNDYMYVPSFMQNGRYGGQGERNESFVHDYEEIDPDKLPQLGACRPRTPTKPSNTMLHGIMNNRMTVKNKTVETNGQSYCDSVNEEKAEELTITADVSPLRRTSSVYQGGPLMNDGTESVKTTAETASEMYSNDSSLKKWPKLEPTTMKLPHFMCPAEKKVKKRCFAVCFVLLVLLIGTFVVASIDGWVYKASGHGLTGGEKPVIWRTPYFGDGIIEGNATDVFQNTTEHL